MKVYQIEKYQNWLFWAHFVLGSWPKVAKALGVTPAMAWRVARGYEPKDNIIRAKFGMDEFKSKVVSVNGHIPDGAYSLGAMKCSECWRHYITNHPRRKKCFICSPFRDKK